MIDRSSFDGLFRYLSMWECTQMAPASIRQCPFTVFTGQALLIPDRISIQTSRRTKASILFWHVHPSSSAAYSGWVYVFRDEVPWDLISASQDWHIVFASLYDPVMCARGTPCSSTLMHNLCLQVGWRQKLSHHCHIAVVELCTAYVIW